MRALAAALVAAPIPWIATVPPRAPAHPPLAPPCAASQLRARLFLQGAGGSLVGGLDLTNAGSRACSLVGRPRVSFPGATARWHVEDVRRQKEPYDVLLDPVGSLRALAPGKTAAAGLWWSNWCPRGAGPAVRPVALMFGLPGGTAIHLSSAQGPRCDRAASPSIVAVSPFAPALLPPPASSKLPLRAAILGRRPAVVKGGGHAFRARRGSLLSFVVRLTNTGARPFRFRGACPPYVLDLGTAPERAYVLNCRPAGTLAPRASARFAMRIRVSARERLGVAALGFTLAPLTSEAPQASDVVEVVP